MARKLTLLIIFFLGLGIYDLGASPVDATSPTSIALPSPESQPMAKPRQDLPGLPNFAKVSDHLYRGAQPTAEGFATLKKMGIKTVVNLRALSSDRSLLKGSGLEYAHIYSKAWHPEKEDILSFLKIMQNSTNWPVFVHCTFGSDRTGMMVASYRMVEEGWNTKETFQEMDQFGFHPIFISIKKLLLEMNWKMVKEELKSIPDPLIETIK